MSVCNDRSEIIDLIQRVRNDDQEAFEKMLCKYQPLLDAAISKFSTDELSKSHEDDLRQEITLVFYNAILNYDICSDGVEFGLYAKICVTNALISQVKKLNKMKAEQLSNAVYIDESALGIEEPSSRIIEEESLKRIDDVIRNNLSSFEYKVWCLYASGRTAKDIGDLVGKSEKSITNAVYRIRKKLRSLLK